MVWTECLSLALRWNNDGRKGEDETDENAKSQELFGPMKKIRTF